MIFLTVEEILSLHEKLIDKTGGSQGIRDSELIELGLLVADGAWNYDKILDWIKTHEV